MRRSNFVPSCAASVLAFLLVVAFASDASAQLPLPPGASQGKIHDPFSPHYNPLLPARLHPIPRVQGSPTAGVNVVRPFPVYPNWYSYRYYSYGAWPNYYSAYPTYYVGYPVYSPYVIFYPPAFGNAAFAPGFFGGAPQGPSVVAQPDAPVIEPGNFVETGEGGFGQLADRGPALATAQDPGAAARKSRAEKFIEQGDNNFLAQRYAEAYRRYNTAVAQAPELGDPYIRRAVARMAIGRFAPAAEDMRRGMTLSPGTEDASFRLGALYGGAKVDKQSHLDALAAAAESADEGRLHYLLGAVLFFDEQFDRAASAVRRAAELDPSIDVDARRFLDAIDSAAKAVEPPLHAE